MELRNLTQFRQQNPSSGVSNRLCAVDHCVESQALENSTEHVQDLLTVTRRAQVFHDAIMRASDPSTAWYAPGTPWASRRDLKAHVLPAMSTFTVSPSDLKRSVAALCPTTA